MPVVNYEQILEYWFEGLNNSSPLRQDLPQFRRWHAKDPATDRFITERFQPEFRELERVADVWSPSNAPEALAAVLLLDQFPRHMFRDTPAMYATDHQALRLYKVARQKGFDNKLARIERMFLYMPGMHAEDLPEQETMLTLFQELLTEAQAESPHQVDFFSMSLGYARQHRDIVARFGRFPHRNRILGRPSTPEEEDFLLQPNSSF